MSPRCLRWSLHVGERDRKNAAIPRVSTYPLLSRLCQPSCLRIFFSLLFFLFFFPLPFQKGNGKLSGDKFWIVFCVDNAIRENDDWQDRRDEFGCGEITFDRVFILIFF